MRNVCVKRNVHAKKSKCIQAAKGESTFKWGTLEKTFFGIRNGPFRKRRKGQSDPNGKAILVFDHFPLEDELSYRIVLWLLPNMTTGEHRCGHA
jgi:hypothetical protein